MCKVVFEVIKSKSGNPFPVLKLEFPYCTRLLTWDKEILSLILHKAISDILAFPIGTRAVIATIDETKIVFGKI